MKLYVRVIEARNILAMDINGLSDPYVKLQLGKQRSKSRVIKKSLNPSWHQEFCFKVEDLNDELIISVLDEDKYFNDDFIGQIKIPISQVFDSIDQTLGTTWYSLQPKNKKLKNKDCGEILLTINFLQSSSLVDCQPQDDLQHNLSDSASFSSVRSSSDSIRVTSPVGSEDSVSSKHSQKFAGRLSQIFSRNTGDKDTVSSTASSRIDSPDIPLAASDEQSTESFEQLLNALESKHQETETPNSLPGGIALDQLYAIAPSELNSLLFSQGSTILNSLAELQDNTDLQVGDWKLESVGVGESLKRVVTYTKAAGKLVKSTRAIEEHTYIKADGKVFAVLATVSTPDVPYGGNFKVEVLYLIKPGPELPSGKESSQMMISWRVNFLQSTMMKSMIEGGARQGIKENFNQYGNILIQHVKPVEMKDIASNKEQVLASLQTEPQSDLRLAVKLFSNFTVLSAIVLGVYVMVHIWLAAPSKIQGFEFVGLDLPDSVGEIVVGGILTLLGAKLLNLFSRFMQAREQKGSDHGIKARGDGWLLTVVLVEGCNLSAVDSSGFTDPYVLFTCNGKTKTSSIKFHGADPQWNEIFEFDAMDDSPSMLDVEVFDFDGPFSEASSLGHTKINFVKSNISDLADVWLPLQGMLAQTCQSKLHLRIFLDNTRGNNVVVSEYLTKMEKEVGKKIKQRSPQTNSAFQKLFGLTAQEFLINDFTCHLKRKMPLQGRLFLSARMIGFHGDIFGRKTNFFFLWEDIEDIQVVPPTLSSMGSPIVVITLKPGRGEDARDGAKIQDAQGRLKFHFQTFVSFNIAYRTVMALWKARALSPEQKVQIAEEESESKMLQPEDIGSFLGVEDVVNQSLVYSSVLAVPTSFFMELFIGSELEMKVMESAGCVNYCHSTWEFDDSDICQRNINYKFNKSLSRFRGEVTSTQQRSHLPDQNNGWLIEEVMTLQGIPLGDYFNLHLKYQIEDLLPSTPKSNGCNVQVFFGIAWLKNTRHQKRIAKSIVSSMQNRLKIIFSTVEKEFASENGAVAAL